MDVPNKEDEYAAELLQGEYSISYVKELIGYFDIPVEKARSFDLFIMALDRGVIANVD